MKAIQKQIVEKLYDIFKVDGFDFADPSSLTFISGQKEQVILATKIDRYGATGSLGLWVGKRYEQIESLVEKYINGIDSARTGKSTTYTLRFDENVLKGIYSAEAGYRFYITENGLNELVDRVVPIIKSKLFPVLEKLNTYAALHEFINNPPHSFVNNAYFFSMDGMTPLRKMIIAKLVNKDYNEVCDWVFNDMIEIQIKAEDLEYYGKYKKVYLALKQELDAR